MRKRIIIILPISIIIFDLLFRYVLNDNDGYALIYYFTISYVCFLFYFLNENRDDVLFRFIIFFHFVILFLYLTIDMIGVLDTGLGQGHVGDWWGIILKDYCFVYPNSICFIVISIILLFQKQTHERKLLSKIIVSLILLLSIGFGLFYYYNINYSLALDYPY